jgi:integral membrane sensor domain MASE1
MKKRIQNQELTTLTHVVMLIALYFLRGLVGRTTTFLSGSVDLVWPPASIALAAILLFGYRFWPGVAPGAVLFSFMDSVFFGWGKFSEEMKLFTVAMNVRVSIGLVR